MDQQSPYITSILFVIPVYFRSSFFPCFCWGNIYSLYEVVPPVFRPESVHVILEHSPTCSSSLVLKEGRGSCEPSTMCVCVCDWPSSRVTSPSALHLPLLGLGAVANRHGNVSLGAAWVDHGEALAHRHLVQTVVLLEERRTGEENEGRKEHRKRRGGV